MPGDASDNVKPWIIQGIPPEERNAASEAAKLSDMTVDELRHAIRTQEAERDRLVAELAEGRRALRDATEERGRLLQRAESARRRNGL